MVSNLDARHSPSRRANWFSIENRAGTTDIADVWIYDEIGFFGVTASDFVQALQQVKAQQIDLHLSTPGGEVFAGLAIYNSLISHPATITVYVDSLAASIGSVIAMAGDKVVMQPHSRMMIHEALAREVGNAADMAKMAQRLDSSSNEIASIYAEHAGGTSEEWRALMKAETWFTDQEAVDAGLADEIGRVSNGKQAALYQPSNAFDLSLFHNVPEDLKAAPVEQNAGRTMSQPNLDRLHAAMGDMQSIHDATCDMGTNCPMYDPNEPMEPEGNKAELNAAIPYGDHGKAAMDAAWTAPALSDFTDQQWDELDDAEKRRIAAHFVWTDSEDPPASFSDLGGPHHEASKNGIGPANWAAVSSGRMAQASWYDDAGVKSHLEAHYHDFGKTAPWEQSNSLDGETNEDDPDQMSPERKAKLQELQSILGYRPLIAGAGKLD